MVQINNIFVVIDPSTDKQNALQRAMKIAKVVDAKIHAYLCLSPTIESHDPEALRRVELARYEPWVENIAETARAEGFNISTEVEWSTDWRHALGDAARRAKSDLIVKSSHRRTAAKRLMMTSSDLALLESTSCSVQLVSSNVVEDLEKVLISVDVKREDEKYQGILNSVIAYGKAVESSAHDKGELHAVYSYSGSDEFRHLTDIAKRIEIDTSRVHAVQGNPEEGIVEVAKEIEADIIVVGLSTKSTLANRIFGSMVDRLLNNIDHDILIVVPEEN
ncbi:MAG: universal stress protein [Gammaproteobacteria bacterium]|jgi:universal stress protein E|nr:universal stress protein [Gammaproteobacteria bacterium]